MTAAVLFALFVWWFSTGAILCAISHGAGYRSVMASAPLAALGVGVLIAASETPGPTGAYLGFSAAILVWGWFELAFLTGVLTGPNRRACPPGVSGWRHFVLAWGTVAHHEIALFATAVTVGYFTWYAPEITGLWTFLILFVARISAKLNVYFGVPNLSHEMLPAPVAHLKGYFANRRMNWVFPVSITALTFSIACWIERAWAAEAGSGMLVGYVLLATLSTLALIEHWLMVLPIRDA
ncbi:MAG: putative photosynthetic complex assembly protein PuhE, partial [Pseudomonadota bacterium]